MAVPSITTVFEWVREPSLDPSLYQPPQEEDHLAIVFLIFKNVLAVDSTEHHVVDARIAFLSALSWHIIRHWLSSAKITIPFHFTKAFAEK